MQRKTLIRKIGECLSEEGGSIRPETRLTELEGWDSVGRLLISALLGQYFKLAIDDTILVRCRTVGDIVGLVKDGLDI